jgi:hypothetical protein
LRADALQSLRSWQWAWRRHVSRGLNTWASWAVLMLATAGVAAGSLWSGHQARQALAALATSQRAVPLPESAPTQRPPPPAGDFTHDLKPFNEAHRVIAELRRACASAGVVVQALSVGDHPPTPQELGRVELTLTLRGGYAATKQLLKALADRYDTSLSVRSLHMRRLDDAGATLESQLSLAVWAAPTAPADQAGPASPGAGR